MENLINWLQAELAEAERFQAEFNWRAEVSEYDDYENEVSRHEQDGWVDAIKYVLRHVKEMK